ncbi:tetratricopeptide repeat protein [Formosa haliotis]|uniref:type IX secretion system periplasmic lipoprotein PorW/SprE n=1 Tax=Formosa haliotis TaxID=1555194 RepID=UPI00082617C9|nr:tetratricopeptide repeat protein [Formosa haliotis]
MKTSFKVIFIACVSAFIFVNCSRKKDKFISRNYHAITTEYNTLYNGNIALEEGRERLNEEYRDNYWEILPVERLDFTEDVMLPGQSKNENFARAEEKAVKAIQKHSMNIKGKEKNPKMDEAYLLLGKARYFDQRFVPALEALNYILYKYPLSDKINVARVWREKTNMRLDNDELAIKNLKRLLRLENLHGQELADATSTLAQAYLNTKVVDTAITYLEIAADATPKHEERGRYLFIKGQLYNSLGYKDSANVTFDRIIEMHRKIPRDYYIGAYVEKAKNFDYETGDKLVFSETLAELEEDRENRPYLGRIYHQVGEFYLATNNDSLGVAYYNKSLRTQQDDKQLNARNYEILGDLSFDNAEYKTAGAYYDSTLTNLKVDSKPYRTIKRERDNLVDVIYYEEIAKVDDSILHLVNLPEADRLAYFEAYTEKLRLQAELERQRQEAELRTQEMLSSNNDFNVDTKSPAFQDRGNAAKNASTFYFYNTTTAAYGKNEFIKNWGDRKNEDNWRWSNMNFSASNAPIGAAAVAGVDLDADIYQTQFYIDQIPTDEKIIDSIAKERNYAYFQLGVIYKEKFSDYELSKTKLQALLNNNPEDRLIVPAKYNLYKDYELLGQRGEAEILKTDIITNHSDSRYAEILSNPDQAVAEDLNSPENTYKIVHELFDSQNYAEVIALCEENIHNFEGDDIVAKFDLLKATAIGRLYGFEAYSKALNDVALTYPNLPEGQRAEELTRNVLPNLENDTFADNEEGKRFNVIFQFENTSDKDIALFVEKLDKQLEKVKYYELSSSKDLYSPTITFVVVHGFSNLVVAEGFKDLFKKNDKNRIKKTYFVMSSANYQVLQIHKNLDSYLNQTQ